MFWWNRRRDRDITAILGIVREIQNEVKELMATTKQLLDELTAEKDLIAALKTGQDAIVAEDAALKSQVAALTAAAGISAEDQANIDAAFAAAEANKAAILAATLANTPAAPAPEVPAEEPAPAA